MKRKYDLEVEKNKMLEFRLELLKRNFENKDKQELKSDSDYKAKRLNDTIIDLEKLLLEERNKFETLSQEKEAYLKEKDEMLKKINDYESINKDITNEINYYLDTIDKNNLIKDYFKTSDKIIKLEEIENLNLETIDEKEENEYFICKICLSIAINPKICENCENMFCSKCIEHVMKNSNNCPCCRHYCNLTKISRFAKTYLNKINIKCPFKCGITIGYSLLESHICNCAKRPLNYSCNKCSKELLVFENYYHIIADHIEQCYNEEINDFDSKNVFNPKIEKNLIQKSCSLERISEARFFYILSIMKKKLNKSI